MSYEPPGLPEDRMNPYAPPLAEVGRHPFELDLGPALPPVPPTAGAIVSRAYEIFKQQMGLCIGVVLGGGGLVSLCQAGLNLISGGLKANGFGGLGLAVVLIGFVGLLVFQLLITVGQSLVMLKVAQGRPARWGEIFSGGRFVLRALIASIIFGGVMLPAVVASVIPSLVPSLVGAPDQALQGILLALGIVVAILVDSVIAARLYPFLYLIIDRDAGALESLGLSMRLTRGRVGLVFSIWLLTLLINIGGFLACLVGLIFTSPLTTLIMAVSYVALVGAASPAVVQPGVATPNVKLPGDPDFGVLP